MSFVEGWLARAAQVDGVVFDFGGVISVSPREGWSLYPFCAARGVGRAAVEAGWARYRHLWDGGFISFEEMYRRMKEHGYEARLVHRDFQKEAAEIGERFIKEEK